MAVRELQASSDRVACSYRPDSLRTSEAACPLSPGVATSVALVAGETTKVVTTKAPLELGADDVVLVTGGAKGITGELALALARQTGVALALLGSSPLPDPQADTQNEILRNLQRLAQEGIRHCYAQCDGTDLAAVQEAASAKLSLRLPSR